MIEDRLIQRVKGLEKKNPIYRDFRAGDVLHSLADISKAQQLLNYQPKHKIDKGLDESMDWYVQDLS
jgi:UDP-N-acetylglucosamine 4-epimerase